MYKRFRCPRGHEFRAYVTGLRSQVTCEECRQHTLRHSTSQDDYAGFVKYQFSSSEVQSLPPVDHRKDTARRPEDDEGFDCLDQD